VSSYAEGINGLILDVARPVDAHQIDETDFIFLTGNVDDLGAWTPLADPPTVTIRPGEGRGTSDRVVLTWAAGEAATNTWLQVTMNAASPETGLYADDVFHFGSAVGETFNSPTNLLTTSADVIAIRDNPRGAGNRADVLNPHDINRDWLVNAADQLLARNHATGPFNALRLVTPTLPPVAPPEAEGAAVTPSVPLLSASRASDGPGDVATPGATGWLLTPGGTGCLSASECDAVVHDFANTGGQAARATLTSPTPLDLVARARALRPTSRDRDDHAPTDAALNDELTVDLLRPLSIAASHHSG